MSKNQHVRILGAVIAFTMASTSVHADSVPWGYSAGNTEIFNSNNPTKSSSVTFSGASGVATGNSGIIIYNMTTSSGVSDTSPDSFSNVPFNLAITLTDMKATGDISGTAKTSDVVHFSGLFSASNVTKASLLPGASPWSSPVTAQVVLGGADVGWRTYSVTLSSFTSPGQPGGSPGSIQAIVMINPTDGPGAPDGPGGSGEIPTPPSAAPEPTSMLLASFGLLPLAIFIRKRKIATQSECVAKT